MQTELFFQKEDGSLGRIGRVEFRLPPNQGLLDVGLDRPYRPRKERPIVVELMFPAVPSSSEQSEFVAMRVQRRRGVRWLAIGFSDGDACPIPTKRGAPRFPRGRTFLEFGARALSRKIQFGFGELVMYRMRLERPLECVCELHWPRP
jgi:hypothetical protein